MLVRSPSSATSPACSEVGYRPGAGLGRRQRPVRSPHAGDRPLLRRRPRRRRRRPRVARPRPAHRGRPAPPAPGAAPRARAGAGAEPDRRRRRVRRRRGAAARRGRGGHHPAGGGRGARPARWWTGRSGSTRWSRRSPPPGSAAWSPSPAWSATPPTAGGSSGWSTRPTSAWRSAPWPHIADEVGPTSRRRVVSIVHRIGVLSPGEAAVVIACAAPHRAPAFRACEEALERLKREVPIWKREVFTDGATVGRDGALTPNSPASGPPAVSSSARRGGCIR